VTLLFHTQFLDTGGIKVEPPGSWLTRFKRISAVNLDEAASPAAHAANIFKIRGENNHRERTRRLLVAEADEVDPFCSGLHVQDVTRNAFGFADVPVSFANGEVVGWLIAACRVGWPVRFLAQPGDAEPGSPGDLAQPSRGRLSPP